MKNKTLILLLITILINTHLMGCLRHTVKSDTQLHESVPILAQQKIKNTENVQQKEMKTDTSEPDSVDVQPAPVEQLHSAMLGLESFRVFGYYSKIQNDQDMLQSLKKPTFEFIAERIDPHLKLKKIIYAPEYENYIASFLYLKAYVFWIHNDVDSARKTIAVLNRTFPHKHPDIIINHFDKGDMALDDALDDLEDIIDSNEKKKKRKNKNKKS
jgi:hypothetical protein